MFIANQKEYDFKTKIAGKYYGYNDCCIQHFSNILKKEFLNKNQSKSKVINDHCIILCEKCSKKSEKQILKEINEKRVHNIPFSKGLNINEEINLNLIQRSNIFSKEEKRLLNKYF
tara:strand:- start:19897 stop:20244 length:348 start_codon:yes stop_codon:yes gene_type:complete